MKKIKIFMAGVASFFVLYFASNCPPPVFSQSVHTFKGNELLKKIKESENQNSIPLNYSAKKSGHYSAADWATVIDATWGEGLPTSEKLQIFDRAWNQIDQGYGAFMNLDVDIDAFREKYRPEIEAGVSRGRFAAIMNYLTFILKDAHTVIVDRPLNWGTTLQPGIPLFVIGVATANDYFGACLTPLPDSSLLVYKAAPNHRLGLAPGDIVLGYDGIPWKQLYRDLIETQLPIRLMYTWGSTDEAMTHILLQSAGLNWHLFDTIDIAKYSTGDTLHKSTAALRYQWGQIWGNEQLLVPGVPMPDFRNEDYITWGIVDGTDIGYIYVGSWHWEDQYRISEQFYEAIYELMFNYETKGLIVDFRLNYGGYMLEANDGYSLLFNETVAEVAFDVRGSISNHWDMVPHPTFTTELFTFVGDPESFYDKPIAVLTGPNAVSNGDWESLRMQFHPMVRTFGKSTNGAFTPSDFPDLGNDDWYFTRGTGSGYLVDSHTYLAHTGAPIDEEVWLTQDDVANGEDTVVKAALRWIQNSIFVHNVSINRKYGRPGADSLHIVAQIENPSSASLVNRALIKDFSGQVIDFTLLFDDGLHNDDAADDGIAGAFWPLPEDEQHFSVNIKTDVVDSSVSKTEFNKNYFTTVGPIVLDEIIYLSTDTLINPGQMVPIRIKLKNEGLTATASNIFIGGANLDTVISNVTTSDITFDDIPPGESVTSNGVFVIYFENNFNDARKVGFELHIYSDGMLFWKDTFFVKILPTGLAEEGDVPSLEKFCLSQNYPNPFNSKTSIRFSIPKRAKVEIAIFDLLGREIITLMDEAKPTGVFSVAWDGRDSRGGFAASGVYIYKISAIALDDSEKYFQSKKLLFLK